MPLLPDCQNSQNYQIYPSVSIVSPRVGTFYYFTLITRLEKPLTKLTKPFQKPYIEKLTKPAVRNLCGTTGTTLHLLYNAIMPACKACAHRDRDRIDRQIIDGIALRPLSRTTGLSLGCLHRHKEHIKDIIRARTQSESETHGSDLLDRVRKLTDEAIGILETAKAAGNLKAATSAIIAAVRTLELTGRLDGSLAQPNAPGLHLTLNKVTNVNVTNYDNDVEFAQLIREATKNFSESEIARLKMLASCNDRAALDVTR
jgi:hypothetical protein